MVVATEAPAVVNFSLELNEEQLQLQQWVHEFAEKVMRPAAHEWDEREETPWPIIEEAAKVGIYGTQFMAHIASDPTGLMLPIAVEELFWGDAGIGMAIQGSGLAVAAIAGNGTPQQIARVGAAVLRHCRTTSSSARSACQSRTPAPTSRG